MHVIIGFLLFISVSARVVPVEDNSTRLDYYLIDTKNSCKSLYIGEELTKHHRECAVAPPPYDAIALRCALFLDATLQVCSSNITVNDEALKSRMTEKLLISDVCLKSKHWNTSTIPKFPDYKKNIDKLLKSEFECTRLCATDDILSDDANFYCKYFNRISELLQPEKLPSIKETNEQEISAFEKPKSDIEEQSSTSTATKPAVGGPKASGVDSSKPAEDPIKENNPGDIKPEDAFLKQLPVSKVTEVTKPQSSNHPSDNQKDKPLKAQQDKPSEDQQVKPSQAQPDKPSEAQPDKPSEAQPDKSENTQEQRPIIKTDQETPIDPILPDNSNPDLPDYDSPVKDTKDKFDEKPQDKPVKEKPQLEDPDLSPDDVEEDVDEDESLNMPVKPEITKSQPQTPLRPETTFLHQEPIGAFVEKNGIIDDDGQDNFFPFFLTIIVLVVLLYVLYHNKNKVTKVVLGLLVEGRQSHRRRNSRGHAYRRLDTLEQAMSSNTAAPPSKIIY